MPRRREPVSMRRPTVAAADLNSRLKDDCDGRSCNCFLPLPFVGGCVIRVIPSGLIFPPIFGVFRLGPRCRNRVESAANARFSVFPF